MPFCPSCRAEYRPEFTRCAECELDLVPELSVETKDEPWVSIYSGPFAQAEVVRATLETAEIETFSPEESITPLGTFSGFFIQVLVKESDAEQARDILKSLERVNERDSSEPHG